MRIISTTALCLLLLFLVTTQISAESHRELGSNPTSVSAVTAYTTVQSAEQAQNLGKELITKNLVSKVLVVPVLSSLPESEEFSISEHTSRKGSHLLLLETTNGLIKDVTSAIKGFLGSDASQVNFSSIYSEGLSYIDLISSKSGNAESFPEEFLRKPQELSGANGLNGVEQNRNPRPPGGAQWVYLDKRNEFEVNTSVGQTVLLLVEGNISTGYSWRVNEAESSPSLQFGAFEPISRQRNPTAIVGAPTLFSLAVVATEPGSQTLILEYVRPWDTADNPTVKVVNFNVV